MAPLKLHLKTGTGGGAPPQPPTPSAAPPPSAGGGGFKLKLSSQPPTPAIESGPSGTAFAGGHVAAKKKRNYSRKDREPGAGKKRAADEDLVSPAAKRVASGAGETRRGSLILKAPNAAAAAAPASLKTPLSAKPRISLKKRQSTAPVLKRLNVKGRVPDRVPGNGYDSEDSERERDPATEQQLILRMQPGEDCDYLRDAITNRTIGLPQAEGGADVSLRFVDRDLRRAVVVIKGRMYAAVLVDLPCLIETMKSWDKKGWWKVADIHQMLLVLGRCKDDQEAKSMALPPRVINPQTMQYAHGLTPPMHWVRKRRFRKRLSYRDTANVEEEVQKLLDEDDRAEREGGESTYDIVTRESLERSVEPGDDYYDDEDADGEPITTIENGDEDSSQLEGGMDEMDVDFAEAAINDLFNQDAAVSDNLPFTSEPVTDSPAPMPDTTASFTGGLQSTVTSPGGGVETPTAVADTPAAGATEVSSDEDEDESEDSESDEDLVDEDAEARRLERAQQMEEVHDLEREVEIQKQKLAGQKNQLLREKTMKQLRSLEEDLRIKKAGLGLEEEEEAD